jgi:hypothetical protein
MAGYGEGVLRGKSRVRLSVDADLSLAECVVAGGEDKGDTVDMDPKAFGAW